MAAAEQQSSRRLPTLRRLSVVLAVAAILPRVRRKVLGTWRTKTRIGSQARLRQTVSGTILVWGWTWGRGDLEGQDAITFNNGLNEARFLTWEVYKRPARDVRDARFIVV